VTALILLCFQGLIQIIYFDQPKQQTLSIGWPEQRFQSVEGDM
jgi:hypothetical protein